MPSSVHQQSLKGTMAMAGPVITLEYFHQTGTDSDLTFCNLLWVKEESQSRQKVHSLSISNCWITFKIVWIINSRIFRLFSVSILLVLFSVTWSIPGQYMQYWFCEYQAEDDAFNSVKKLHGNIHTLESRD